MEWISELWRSRNIPTGRAVKFNQTKFPFGSTQLPKSRQSDDGEKLPQRVGPDESWVYEVKWGRDLVPHR